MAVGQGSLISGLSYVAVGRESAIGTYNTCTSILPVLSSSLKTLKETKILEQIAKSRTHAQRISLSKVVEGELEFYFQPRLDACQYILQNAMGGTVTSATATGETTGAGANSAMTHTFLIGNMDQSAQSLCINQRKGGSSGGKVWQYHGARVNELMFTAEIDEPLVCKAAMICIDSTQVSNDVESALGSPTSTALSFDAGRLSVEASFASLTSSSYWHIISTEFGWSNSLKADSESRRIGSDILAVLPPGIAVYTLNCTIRFDTTTAYDAMMSATQLSAELEFLGPTLPSSAIRQGLKLQYPKVYISDAGDPEISGPDNILTSEVTFVVLRDDSSSTGYAMRAQVTNQATGYSL